VIGTDLRYLAGATDDITQYYTIFLSEWQGFVKEITTADGPAPGEWGVRFTWWRRPKLNEASRALGPKPSGRSPALQIVQSGG